ncbi:uncharacterized protein [Diadema antillarum]|uniref:uncharacterized protein n=1 Tax=Diadema antillarum TaxID=105358 RepID=UPI003A892D3F
MKGSFAFVFAFAVIVGIIDSFGTGPPVRDNPTLCSSLQPLHDFRPNNATGPPPYMLTAAPVENSTSITVRLEADEDSTFAGFLLVARPQETTGTDSDDSIGTFTEIPAGTAALDCFEGDDNAWGHNSNAPKTAVESVWVPPSGTGNGDVLFRATVVMGPANTYWMNVDSDVTAYSSAGVLRVSILTICGGLLLGVLTGFRM